MSEQTGTKLSGAPLNQNQLEKVAELIQQRGQLLPVIRELETAPGMKITIAFGNKPLTSCKTLHMSASELLPALLQMREKIGAALRSYGIESNGI